MSLHHIANHLASKGRNGDSTLVHMTNHEVAGLQSLAKANGTSLTVNPHTGLPEAFSLKSLLPLAAGFMLGPAGFGLASSAMGAGLMVGGATALGTGSLKKGLMAGLGAYGGAGLGAGIGGASAATPSAGGIESLAPVSDAGTAIGSGPLTTNPVTQANFTGTPLGSLNESGQFATGFQPSAATTANGPIYTGVPETSAQSGIDLGGPGSSPANMGYQNPTYSSNYQNGADIGGTGSSPANMGAPKPTGIFNQIAANAEQNPKYLAAAAAPILADEMSQKPVTPNTTGDTDMGQRYTYNPGYDNSIPGRTGLPSYEKITGEQAKKYYGFAEGGDVSQDPNMQQVPAFDPVVRMAQGGISGLMNYANGGSTLGSYSDGGRMLKGPGDGMSDSIPAKIGEKQPARLADGEFVVPADVVSHLGNGSTDAGAKQLYKMMDNIRTARTGRKSQGKQINPNKFMPA